MASSAIFCFYVAGGVFRKKKMDVPMRMTQYTVEQAGLSPPYILYDKLGVSGSKEPVPVQYGCQQGGDARDGKNSLNDVLAHQK